MKHHPLLTLPDDVWMHAFEFLETTDAYDAAQVSKHWSTLLRQVPCLWRICRVAVEHNVAWPITRQPPTGVLTRRQKRLRDSTVSIPPILRAVGRCLFRLSIGSVEGWCDLTLRNEHLRAVGDACPSLHKLKLYMTHSSPDLSMSALNYMVMRCPSLKVLGLPVNAGALIMDELPVRYNSIQCVKLHGTLSWKPVDKPQTWLLQNVVALQLVNVSNLNHMHLVQYCTNLRHLILDGCESTQDHPLHIQADMDAFDWMYEVATRLHTFALVRSSTVMCVCYLLSSLTLASGGGEGGPWSQLHSLWLDADTGDHNMNLQIMFSCIDCTTYGVYKHHVATEVNRCAECRTRVLPRLETVYLVH